jgi:hypothetical protein
MADDARNELVVPMYICSHIHAHPPQHVKYLHLSGLPDFSGYNIPKTGEKLPNNHKIQQMATK